MAFVSLCMYYYAAVLCCWTSWCDNEIGNWSLPIWCHEVRARTTCCLLCRGAHRCSRWCIALLCHARLLKRGTRDLESCRCCVVEVILLHLPQIVPVIFSLYRSMVKFRGLW